MGPEDLQHPQPDRVHHNLPPHRRHRTIQEKSNVRSETGVKRILESETITKVTFDVRDLAAILYCDHGIIVNGFVDTQLMELASTFGKTRWKRHAINRLEKCVEDEAENFYWMSLKPWRLELRAALWETYYRRFQADKTEGKFWMAQVRFQTAERVRAVVANELKPEDEVLYNMGPSAWYGSLLRDQESGLDEGGYEERWIEGGCS
jgi:hypothetical protein